MGYLKFTRRTSPRPIVSSRCGITYGVAKKLANIRRPLVEHSPHDIRNTQHLVDQVKHIRLEEGGCITAYDVKALFTSVPVDPAISISKYSLLQDTQHSGTSMSIHHIITQLEFCPKNTYFLFQSKYDDGAAISPIVAKLFMEEFETKAINTTTNLPRLCLRYVGGIFCHPEGRTQPAFPKTHQLH